MASEPFTDDTFVAFVCAFREPTIARRRLTRITSPVDDFKFMKFSLPASKKNFAEWLIRSKKPHKEDEENSRISSPCRENRCCRPCAPSQAKHKNKNRE